MATKKFSFPVREEDFKFPECSNPLCLGGCVLIAIKPEGVALRDSKDTKSQKTTMFFTNLEWDHFLKGVRNGEFEIVGTTD
jgi:hypothetical protein